MLGLPDGIEACLFDLDGVLTPTATVHAKAWKEMFDDYLRRRAERTGEAFVPFDSGHDYEEYVDGKPRYDGVKSFLASRGIELPQGTPDDAPGDETIDGLGNRKNELVLALIKRDGVEPYEGSVRYVHAARDAGLRCAVVSSSANTHDVLDVTGMSDLFEAVVDGNVTAREGLRGKPAPDTFLEGARRLGAEASRAAVFEDAVAGVEAGHAGGFGHVVGVDRVGHADALKAHGADVVVRDLAELLDDDGDGDGRRRVIEHPSFAVEPWVLRETELNLDLLAQSESLFALANGHIGLRGNLDEGDPNGVPGTYLNGFHEVRPLPYAESAYGNPEAGETLLGVTDGKLIRLLVDDELFDVRYGELLEHERVLDFRAGVLRRRAHWRSPAGGEVRVSSTRIVSLAQRGAAAILYEVEPVHGDTRLVVQSELVANQDGLAEGGDGDPRAAARVTNSLVGEEHYAHDQLVLLVHRARNSGLRMSAAMDHEVEGPDGTTIDVESAVDAGRVTIAADVPRGGRLRILKYLAYGWSGHRSVTSVRAQVRGSIAEARHTGFDGLCAAQREVLDGFWARADIEIEGDTELQQAVRFCLFHVLQSGARAERRAIAAKGLTGAGYDGHAFWDTESFVLPVLTYTAPDAARDALRWRHSTLDLAFERARQLGLDGAAFPWRTIAGRECSGYWPASTSAFHVNADIADAVVRYQAAAVGDTEFARTTGLDLLVATARLWRSVGHHDVGGGFRIDGVTGPDEYSAIADNNVYTNLMAKRNLVAAADAAEAHPQEAHALGVDTEETAAWRDAAADIVVPWDDRLGVHCQADNFTNHAIWDFDATPPEMYPLLLHAPYFDLYRKQVVKQADLVLALWACGDEFTPTEKQRDFEYYEALTVRDSSLSACAQSVVAAETGHLDLAYDYLGEAAFVDLHDLNHNTRDGLHMASLAGCWLALVCGLGGFRDHGGTVAFAPRLPEPIGRLCFRLGLRGRCLVVDVDATEATYRLEAGEALGIVHHGEAVEVAPDESLTRPIPPQPRRNRPRQPAGREPRRRAPNRPGPEPSGG